MNITLLNAQLSAGNITSLRIVGPLIGALGVAAEPGDSIVDLEGDRVLPGLINAHDHLHLNSLARPDFGKSYRHVRDWIADVDARRRSDPEFKASVAVARDERLLIGGVKNLLSGVTTVAHHDPLYPYLANPHYPIHVVRDYGWAHSLDVDGEDKVRRSHRSTPSEAPFIMHAAEGVDAAAGHEFERLEALGCLGASTLLVHGVALGRAQRERLAHAGAGLLWCPSSNLNLFGQTAAVSELAARGRVALGTDSRLSGARDLLEELRLVARLGVLGESSLEAIVTSASARLLRLRDRGELTPQARADILVLPARTRLGAARRADVRLVLIDGMIRYGDRDYAERLAPRAALTEVRVDGRAKVLDRNTAALISHAQVGEAGLELAPLNWRAA
ncbi:MAG TPA: amidohydrolase family protein [Steroidobacteraceae bacterium]